MGSDKKDLIAKLEEISAQYAEVIAIKSEMDGFVPEDCYNRKVIVPQFLGEYANDKERNAWQEAIEHDRDDAIQEMAKAYKYVRAPKQPKKPEISKEPTLDTKTEAECKQKGGCFPVVGIFVGALSLLTLLTNGSDLDSGTLIGNWIILAICVAAIGHYYHKLKQAKTKDQDIFNEVLESYERNNQELLDDYDAQMKEYQQGLVVYEQKCKEFLQQYAAWREIYLQHLAEEAVIKKQLENDRAMAVKKIQEERYAPALQKLEANNDLVTVKYLPVLNTIIDLIKSGRADDLKEAVNLYEDLVYREKQLQLQREQEEQRRYEEEQRRQDEERHHREQMKFQQDQERQRRYEEEQRRQEDERRHREDMKQREQQERDRQYAERRQQEENRRRQERAELDRKREERNATQRQCNTCSQVGHCSMAFRRPNCASYRPR